MNQTPTIYFLIFYRYLTFLTSNFSCAINSTLEKMMSCIFRDTQVGGTDLWGTLQLRNKKKFLPLIEFRR